MIKLPQVFGLMLCERMDFSSQPGRASLVGLFHAMQFPAFPTPAQRFTVYTLLYDGVGEGTMELAITRLETEQEIYFHRRWHKMIGRGRMTNLEIQVGKCVFPCPGRYKIDMRFDQRYLTHRYLDVLLERG